MSDEEADLARHFPLNVLFDTVAYRKATNNLTADQIVKVDDLQSRFKEVKIPYQTLESDDKAKVSIVFERINRKGVPLDAYQLLTAWTWSEDFDLKQKFEDLAEELKYYGFEEVGSNINLLMRIGSGILTADGSLTGLINLNGASVRNRFDEITNGVKGAIDFLKANLGVQKLENLPYETLLIPLAAFFSNKGNRHFTYNTNQRSALERWFWRACFSKRYSAGTLRAINKDIEEMLRLKENQPNNLASINVSITDDYFKKNGFTMGTVHTKTFILMLAQNKPKSFVSGSPVTLNDVLKEYNKNEFHHIYPRAFLKTKDSTLSENCLANFCFMSRADNKRLGGDAPSIYKQHMAENPSSVLSASYIDADALFRDDFDSFVEIRANALTVATAQLLG